MATKKRWSDLSPRARAAVLLSAVVELVITTVAARDLRSRAKVDVRGPKTLWAAVFMIQPIGPILYLLVGRRSR